MCVLALKTPILGPVAVWLDKVLSPFQWGCQTTERSVVMLDVARCASLDGGKQDNLRHPAAQRSIGYPQTDAPLGCNGASVVS